MIFKKAKTTFILLIAIWTASVHATWEDYEAGLQYLHNTCAVPFSPCDIVITDSIWEHGSNWYAYSAAVTCRCPSSDNWSSGAGTGAIYFTTSTATTSDPPRCPQSRSGSIVNVDDQSVGETVPIVGANFGLTYSSLWAHSRASDYTVNLPVTGNPAGTSPASFAVDLSVLGNLLDTQTISNIDDQVYSYTWNGLDGSGNPVLGSVLAEMTVTGAGGGWPAPATLAIGTLNAKLLGFGGWLPSNFHFYDQVRKVLYRGDGSTRAVTAITISGGHLLVPEADGSLVYEFSSAGKHLYTRTGLLGTVIATFNYNGAGLLSSIDEPFSRTTTFNRDMSGNLTSIVSPDGAVTTASINGSGLLASIADPGSATFTFTYGTGTDLLATFTKPGSQVTTFAYDAGGRAIQDSHSGGYAFDISQSATSAIGYNSTETTSMGRITTGSVTNNWSGGATAGGYSRSVYLPSGAMRTYSENTGAVTSLTNGVSESYSLQDDVRFGSTVKFPASHYVDSRYQSAAQSVSLNTPGDIFSINTLTTTTTLNGFNTTKVFNGSTKVTTTTSAEGRVSTVTADSYERPTETQWASDTSVNYGYTNDKLTSIVQGPGTTTFSYGTSGFLSSVTDALGRTTSYVYDNAGRPTYVTYPDSRYVQLSYDNNGNVTGITPPSTSLHAFTLTGEELLGVYAPPTLTGVSVVNTTYSYNNDRQLTQITRPDSQTLLYNYGTSSGVLESIATPLGTTSFGFDTSNERYNSAATSSLINSTLAYSSGLLTDDSESDGAGPGYVGDVALGYNTLRQQSSETWTPKSGTARTVNFTYDKDELLKVAGDITLTRSSTTGRVSATTMGSAHDSWSYNSKGELTGYTFSFGTSPLYAATITRDVLGRVSTLSETVQGTSSSLIYGYGTAGQLVDVTKGTSPYSHYNYDPNMNRTSGNTGGSSFTATVDAQDRLTAYNTYNFTYNANGEMTKKVNTATSGTTSFTYDSFGQLKSVKPPTGSTISYDYDGFGRRFVRKSGSTVQSYYLYKDGLRIVAEMTSAGAFKKEFVYGTRRQVPDYMFVGSTKYRLVTDQLGSVRLVVKTSDGSVAQKLEYNELGNVITDTNPGFQPFGYAGGLYDSSTGLLHFGARDYDPGIGRWLSKDPIGFAGGDTNLYGYVVQDPVNFIDQTGLYKSPDGGGGGGDGGSGGGGAGGGAGGSGGMCNNNHDDAEQSDYAICRSLKDPAVRQRCWASAAERDGARRNGRWVPPLITYRVPIIIPWPLLPELIPLLL